MPRDPVAPLVADYARYRADEAIRLEHYALEELEESAPSKR